MTDFPRSLIEFQQRFPNEAACVEYLFAARWPQGFRCPGCGNGKAWQLQTKPWTWECAGLSLVFWTWMSGPMGAFLASPLLIVALIVREHLRPDGSS